MSVDSALGAISTVGAMVAIAGTGLLVIAAFGLFRLPDALARQHAATKSVTLALGMILIGMALHQHGVDPSLAGAWWGRVTIIAVLLLLTLPVSAHMLGRAAAREACSPQQLRASPRVEDGAQRTADVADRPDPADRDASG